ncbi:MAG: penicillin-binding protein [Oscillospiraceae bacterium]|nr:penicillin-binding protein [Oscillospiraceae bacterium]
MNRIAGRAAITVLLTLLLIAGFSFFVAEYVTKANDWVLFTGSPHIYNGTNIGTGTVIDREGVMLLDMEGERTYGESAAVRKSTLHWLGDRYGYISAPALSHYSAQLAGYDIVNGVYSYGQNTGVAKLSISAQVQTTALEALDGRKGTVAVYNYETGEILCAVTSPTYDPDNVPDIENDQSGAYDGVYVNRFTQSVFIPGSIFKIVTLAAALETVDDIQQQSFYCDGVYTIGADKITCEAAHGNQDLQQAFRNSCNTAFAQVALQVGAEKMEKYVEQFGVTKSVSFDGITTAEGNYEAVDAADANIAWSGIGQYNDQINPCAFLTFLGAIAKEGKGVEPHIVSQIFVGLSETYEADTVSGKRIMSAATAETVAEFMRSNVEYKYGDDNFPGLTVCAKTGTGEVGGDNKPNAMLAGFVTDPEYPLAFVVFVENGGYGASVCLPIASRVLEACKNVI